MKKCEMQKEQSYLQRLQQTLREPKLLHLRQHYHFMGLPGWINDPNGLVYYKGKYHCFYQYNPFGLTWGQPCWGHAVSEDLLRWTQLPPALVPDQPYDTNEQGGCFSGSALVVGERLYLIYTGVCFRNGKCVQAQCLAWSNDGVNFEKNEKNPVAYAPEGVDASCFRDPKLWQNDDGTFCFVCGAKLNGDGAALLFRSADLLQWTYCGVLAASEGRFGDMWECPDLFPLGNQYMLCLSPMHCPAYRNVCLIGYYDRQSGALREAMPVCPDEGPDYYAAQSFTDANGRRVQLAWANGWDWMPEFHGWGAVSQGFWRGWFTLPRVVTPGVDGHPRFRPHPQLQKLRIWAAEPESLVLRAPWTLPDEHETAWELFLKLSTDETGAQLSLQVGQCLLLELDVRLRTLRMFCRDEEESELRPCGEIRLTSGQTPTVHVFLDRCSAEVFADDGRACLSVKFFDARVQRPVTLRPASGSVRLQTIRAWALRHVNEESES